MSHLGALQIAAILMAVGWPLAGGVVLVLLSKARAADRARRLAAIEGEIQGLFRTVANQAVPARLELVVDALEEQAAMTPAPSSGQAAGATGRPPRKTVSAS